MSAYAKLQLSRLGIISALTVFLFASLSAVAMAQSVGDVKTAAVAVADMDAMQLLAAIAIVSILALVLVVGFYVKSVSAFQAEISAKMATMTTVLKEVSDNCNRKTCPR